MVLQRFLGVLIGLLAALALLLAAMGIYSLLAYAVTQRTAEIGLRMALGATAAGVRWMVLRQVAAIAGVGALLGLGAALPIGRAAQSLLVGLPFHDPAVLGTAVTVLALVALAAGFLPARRAARIDPMRALKHE
jgi:ABC-type antimicrobial peptide transport system permease subunit